MEEESVDAYNAIITGGAIFFGLLFTALLVWVYLKKYKSKTLLNYVPTVWTSLGILGTFVTIVVRLSSINDYKDVTTLINNLAPAFWTSIIGISGAIISSLVIKYIYAKEEDTEFYDLVRKSGGNVFKETPISMSPELALLRIEKHSSETNKVLNQVTSLLQSLRNEFEKNANAQVEKLTEFYGKVFETNKAQAEILTQEYLAGIKEIISSANNEISTSTKTVISEHADHLNTFFGEEITKIGLITQQIQTIITQIPDSFDSIKNDLIEAIEKMLLEKYQIIIDGNTALTTQLLEDVRKFASELSKDSATIHSAAIDELNKNISGYLTSLEDSLKIQVSAIDTASKAISESGCSITEQLKESSVTYGELINDLNRLIPALNSVVSNSDEYIKQGANTTQQLEDLIKSIEQIVNKNQQLRYELMQWKRVHRKVKINDAKGTKECPNCHEENPMDANFCRKCAYGFWDCETIGSQLSKSK